MKDKERQAAEFLRLFFERRPLLFQEERPEIEAAVTEKKALEKLEELMSVSLLAISDILSGNELAELIELTMDEELIKAQIERADLSVLEL